MIDGQLGQGAVLAFHGSTMGDMGWPVLLLVPVAFVVSVILTGVLVFMDDKK